MSRGILYVDAFGPFEPLKKAITTRDERIADQLSAIIRLQDELQTEKDHVNMFAQEVCDLIKDKETLIAERDSLVLEADELLLELGYCRAQCGKLEYRNTIKDAALHNVSTTVPLTGEYSWLRIVLWYFGSSTTRCAEQFESTWITEDHLQLSLMSMRSLTPATTVL